MSVRNFFCRTRCMLVAVLLLAAGVGTVTAQPTTGGNPEEITVLTPAPPTLPGFSPWILAQYRGYYRDAGLKVNLVAASGGGVQVAKLVGAGTFFAGSSVGDAPVILRPNGIPIKVVAVMGGRSLMQVAVSADDDKIKGPGDLRGKVVSAGSYTDSVYYSFLGMLAKNGIKRSEVDVQAAGPTGVWQLFVQGKADAMIGTPDWIVAAQNAGKKMRILYGEDQFPSLPQAIVVSDNAIKERPDLVEKLVTATLRGLRDVMDDPHAASLDFVKAVPSYVGKEAYVEQIISGYARDVYPGQKILGRMDIERLKNIQDFYLKEGIVRTTKPLDDFYTDQFVKNTR